MAAKYSVVAEGIITEELLKNLTRFEGAIEGDAYKDLIVAKVAAMLVLGIASFVVGLLPMQLAKWFKWSFHHGNLVLSLLLCFGGGVLMFTTFVHLQPEVRQELEHLITEGKAPDFEGFADLVFCAGFFFVYLIEEIVHGIVDGGKQDPGEGDTFFQRNVSVRGRNSGRKVKDVDRPREIVPPDRTIDLNGSSEIGPKSNSTRVLLEDPTGGIPFGKNYPLDFLPEAGSFSYSKTIGSSVEGSSGRENSCAKPVDASEKGSPRGFFDEDGNSSSFEGSFRLANTFRGFFTVLALSFHAVFEGLAVGLESEVSNVWYLFLAIATHKFVISFCVGVDLISTKTRTVLVMLYLGTFAFVTPLGIGIGIGLSSDPAKSGTELSTVVLQGMAAGTLLYVVFFEVLQRERANEQSGMLQLVAIMAGFGVMLGLQFVTGHQHHHHHHQFDLSHLPNLEPGEVVAGGNSRHHHHHQQGDIRQ